MPWARNFPDPPARAARPFKPKEPVHVAIQTSGDLFIADKATTLRTLAAYVCAAVRGDPCTDERVFVRARPDVTYDRFRVVMNGLQANGFLKIGLLNQGID